MNDSNPGEKTVVVSLLKGVEGQLGQEGQFSQISFQK